MRQFSGVYPAVVIDNVDPANSGRVRVRLARLSGPGQEGHEAWARIATLMAGNNRGTWFIPDVNDEVLVAFEGGDVRQPYVLGALWSGTNSPPATMDTDNTKKLLRSRSGMKITPDDQSGQQSFIVETPRFSEGLQPLVDPFSRAYVTGDRGQVLLNLARLGPASYLA